MSTLIIYHAFCYDGFAAAYLFKRAFPDAEMFAAQYGSEPPDVKGKEVYIVDFTYSPEVTRQLINDAKSLKVLDHHAFAVRSLENIEQEFPGTVIYAADRSGAGLAWEYLWDRFIPDYSKYNTDDEKSPYHAFIIDAACEDALIDGHISKEEPIALVKYIQDRDLWTWNLPNSKEINAAIQSYELSENVFKSLCAYDEYDFSVGGAAILRSQEQTIKKAVLSAREVSILGHKVLCVNATTLVSEIGAELAKNRPFGVVYYDSIDRRHWSLRSNKATGGIDTSVIARNWKGGGHWGASGLSTPFNTDIFDKE